MNRRKFLSLIVPALLVGSAFCTHPSTWLDLLEERAELSKEGLRDYLRALKGAQ